MRLSVRLLKNDPRFGSRFNKKALTTRKTDEPSQFQEPPNSSGGGGGTPQWLLIAGSFFGVFVAFSLMQRLFPRQVHVIHKDEYGNVIGNPSRKM